MINFGRKLTIFAAAMVMALAISDGFQPSQALTNGGSITALGTPLTEQFDSLATTGANLAWTDNSTIPGGYSTRPTYNAGTGASTTGALYSFGAAGVGPVGDRALGSVGSNTTGDIYWAVKLTNNTGTTITSLDVSFVGEQWRDGGNTPPVAQTLDFQYQIAAAGVITDADTPSAGWVDHNALDFVSPTFTTTATPLDGNLAANRTAKSSVISVTVANGQEIWLRWKDINNPNNDLGLAIDDFSVTAFGTPVDPAPTVLSTSPSNGAANVLVNSTITINFSEAVNANSGSFSIQCPNGTPRPFSQTGSPEAGFILTPAAPLPYNTTCTVTVIASQITDADVNDPLDFMASNHVFSFTTEPSPIDPAPTVLSIVLKKFIHGFH